MNTARRLTATALATAALVAPSALAATAAAAPDKPTKPAKAVKAQTKQLLKDIAGKDKRLARLSTSNAVERLADRVLMLRQGKIVDSGSPDDLLFRYSRQNLEEVFLDIARDRRAAGEVAANGSDRGDSSRAEERA